MYICKSCNATFLAPKEYYEAHSFNHPPYELFRECPVCSSTYIEESVNCKYKRNENDSTR